MQIRVRLLLVSITLSVLLGGERPSQAEASGCIGCPTNSPIVNSFPVWALRWGTAKVLDGTPNCKIARGEDASIAIAELPSSGKVRGYQLVVVGNNNRQLCQGAQLTGVKFEISNGWEPYIIQQIGQTALRQQLSPIDSKVTAGYRLVYFISAAVDPDESICHNGRSSANRFYRRWWRKAFNRVGPRFSDYPPPQISESVDEVIEVQDSHLDSFAVVIPDAAYTADGIAVNLAPRSKKLASVPYPKLEWFEIACAGGALAHTELSGLVELGDDKAVRTAALRMFLGKYKDDHDTVPGVTIQVYKHKRSAALGGQGTQERLPPGRDGGKVEAQWDETGAVCLSHARMWLRDTLVTEGIYYRSQDKSKTMSLAESESAFKKELGLQPCGEHPRGYFTSYVTKDHIKD